MAIQAVSFWSLYAIADGFVSVSADVEFAPSSVYAVGGLTSVNFFSGYLGNLNPYVGFGVQQYRQRTSSNADTVTDFGENRTVDAIFGDNVDSITFLLYASALGAAHAETTGGGTGSIYFFG